MLFSYIRPCYPALSHLPLPHLDIVWTRRIHVTCRVSSSSVNVSLGPCWTELLLLSIYTHGLHMYQACCSEVAHIRPPNNCGLPIARTQDYRMIIPQVKLAVDREIKVIHYNITNSMHASMIISISEIAPFCMWLLRGPCSGLHDEGMLPRWALMQ